MRDCDEVVDRGTVEPELVRVDEREERLLGEGLERRKKLLPAKISMIRATAARSNVLLIECFNLLLEGITKKASCPKAGL